MELWKGGNLRKFSVKQYEYFKWWEEWLDILKLWCGTVPEDLKTMEIKCEQAEPAAENRLVWQGCVSQVAGGMA